MIHYIMILKAGTRCVKKLSRPKVNFCWMLTKLILIKLLIVYNLRMRDSSRPETSDFNYFLALDYFLISLSTIKPRVLDFNTTFAVVIAKGLQNQLIWNLSCLKRGFKISFLLHTTHSILGQILNVISKFELILMKTDTAQAFLSLHGNY